MIGLLLPSAVAALIGVACGGSLARCLSARVAWWPMLLAAFAVELVLYNPPINRLDWAIAAGPRIWALSKVLMLAVLARNAVVDEYSRRAWLVIFVGIALNTLAIVANGGHMPQSPEAAAAVWGADYVRADAYSGRLENVSWMSPDSRLPWLCDVLPLPRWLPRPNVLSIGDVLLALGVGGWILGSVLPTPDAVGERQVVI
jgi:Family of unknown function (DUF5317)